MGISPDCFAAVPLHQENGGPEIKFLRGPPAWNWRAHAALKRCGDLPHGIE
jgi:hypothetical protein